jgi:hypothetical protein
MTAVSCAWAAGMSAEGLPFDAPVLGAATEINEPKHTIPDVRTARERRGSFINMPLPNWLYPD